MSPQNHRSVLPFIVIWISLLLFTSPAYADKCSQWVAQAESAYPQQKIPILQSLHTKIERSSCDAMDKNYIALNLSRLMYNKMITSHLSGQAYIEGLYAILDIMPMFWPALVDLGDNEFNKQPNVKYDNIDYNKASSYYDRALAAINNPKIFSDELIPDAMTIQNLYVKAERAILASPSYIPTNSRGTSAFKTRGVNPHSRNLPIHFDFGRKVLMGNDKKSARNLFYALKSEHYPNITLIGHTDPIGNNISNQKLSLKRAKAVKQFLKNKGYKGNIKTIGEGENQPLSDPHTNPLKHYGKNRWHRMLRRVEVRTQ